MKIEQCKEIADAVLYEGYLLYPYRHSALKNRQRWTIGVIYPRAYSEMSNGSNPSMMRTECLVERRRATSHTSIDIHVRFLHLLTHTERLCEFSEPEPHAASMDVWVNANRCGNEIWEEAVEREVNVYNLALDDLIAHPQPKEFTFPGSRQVEYAAGQSEKEVVREQQALYGSLTIEAKQLQKNVFKLNISIENKTPGTGVAEMRYDALLSRCFVSTHTILQVRHGAFISLLEFPDTLKDSVQQCENRHTWPVLAGKQGERDTILSSPIILYDYPRIAPESAGTLFDGTEIDEILTLRIMTLTDEEKQEVRQGDSRARALLDRTENLTSEQRMQLHGAMRDLRFVDHDANSGQPLPMAVHVSGGEAMVGDHVRLHPKKRADAFDILLQGKTAQVEAIKQDFEDRTYLVVAVDDDPGREQPDERVLPGHRFFFFPEEIELLQVARRPWGGIQL